MSNQIDYTNVALNKTCRVLIALYDKGPMTTKELELLLGFGDYTSSICSHLCAKGKVKRQNPLSKTGFVWEAVEEPEISTRPKHVENRPRSNGTCISMVKRRDRLRPSFISVNYREDKIKLLRKMSAKVYGREADLLLGMIADYELRREVA